MDEELSYFLSEYRKTIWKEYLKPIGICPIEIIAYKKDDAFHRAILDSYRRELKKKTKHHKRKHYKADK